MPAASDDETLRALHEVEAFEMKYPEAFEDLVELVDRNRRVGYSNLCKIVLGRIEAADFEDED